MLMFTSDSTRQGVQAIFAGAEGDRAAAQLAAALAAPGRGPLGFATVSAKVAATPLLRHLCRALTADSPLTELSLMDSGLDEAGALEVAAALAPGRSRVKMLGACQEDLSAGTGCVFTAGVGCAGGCQRRIAMNRVFSLFEFGCLGRLLLLCRYVLLHRVLPCACFVSSQRGGAVHCARRE